MTNFGKKLKEVNDEELESGVNEHDPRFGVLESNELIKRSINKLEMTIETFNKQSSKQTSRMIFLTWVIVGLTVAMLLGLIIQIILVI